MKPFSLKVEKFCKCMDLRVGMMTMGVSGILFFCLSLSFGILAATVEALSAQEASGDVTGDLVDRAQELAGNADTASGFATRSNFGFPYFHFGVVFLATCFSFFSVFIRDNRQQQVCAIFAGICWLITALSCFIGWVLAIAYASGCPYGDKKCGSVGILCCFYFLLLTPVQYHYALVCNAWRERLGGRPLSDILFGDAPKAASRGAMIGKGTDMPPSQMPGPRPQLAVPPTNFANNQSPRPGSQVGSVSNPHAGSGLPPRGPSSMVSGMTNFSSMQSQQAGLQHAATAGAFGVAGNKTVGPELSSGPSQVKLGNSPERLSVGRPRQAFGC